MNDFPGKGSAFLFYPATSFPGLVSSPAPRGGVKGTMLPLSFLRLNGRLIAFGMFIAFASSFGQTFFISLFGGEIRAAFGLSHGAFGSIYAAGTLASAATLVWAGLLIDRGASIEAIAAASGLYCLAASALAATTLRPERAVA